MPNLMIAKCLISNAWETQKAELPALILSLPAWGRETDVAALDLQTERKRANYVCYFKVGSGCDDES